VEGREIGERVGIPWLGRPAASAPIAKHRENLCDRPVFTGYTRNGGYATRAIADAHYAFRLSEDSSAARLRLCSVPAHRLRSLSFAAMQKL